MCGRFNIDLYEENLKAKAIIEEVTKNNINNYSVITNGDVAPSQFAPILCFNEPTAAFTVLPMKWGFETSYNKCIINARSETAHQKPVFGKYTKAGRCLVPCKGFYEWKKANSTDKSKKSTPYLFTLDKTSLFYMCGLYKKYDDGIYHFTILTADANKQLAQYHHRMPLPVLDDSLKKRWLVPSDNYTQLLNAVNTPAYTVEGV